MTVGNTKVIPVGRKVGKGQEQSWSRKCPVQLVSSIHTQQLLAGSLKVARAVEDLGFCPAGHHEWETDKKRIPGRFFS